MRETWNEISVTINSLDAGIIDLVNYVLNEAGANGTQTNYAQGYLDNHPDLFGEIPLELSEAYLSHPVVVVGYFEDETAIQTIKDGLDTIETLEYRVDAKEIKNENWHENWMKYYKPQRLSRFLSIVPEWQRDYSPEPNEQIIFMDPGVAFGTGSHPTTQLSAQALELIMKGGETVLDVGTGTGILSFVAAVFGAEDILGMDLDEQAVSAANNNLSAQKDHPLIGKLIEDKHIEFIANNLLNGIDKKANIIVANILPHILVNMLEDAYKLLEDDGYLILGGILSEKTPLIEEALSIHQFEIMLKTQMGQWVNYIVVKGEVD